MDNRLQDKPEGDRQDVKTSKSGMSSESDASYRAARGVSTDQNIDREHSQFKKGQFKDEAVHQKSSK